MVMGLQHAFAMVGGLITPPVGTYQIEIETYGRILNWFLNVNITFFFKARRNEIYSLWVSILS